MERSSSPHAAAWTGRALHFVTVFDGTGTQLRSWFQPGLVQSSAWGFRDGATDSHNLFFGFELGIQIVDVNGVILDGQNMPNLQAANGSQSITGGLINGNVLMEERASIIRALAYDRYGNGGEGSFWTGNFGSSIFEIDTAGDEIRCYRTRGKSATASASIQSVGWTAPATSIRRRRRRACGSIRCPVPAATAIRLPSTI